MRTILTLLFASFQILSFCNTSPVELTAKEKNAVDILKLSLFLQNCERVGYLDIHTYDYKRDADGSLLIYPKAVGKHTNPMVNHRHHYFKIRYENNQPSSIGLYNDCERNLAISFLKWEGDRITQTNGRLEYGKIVYDSSGKISGMNLGQIQRRRNGKNKIYSDRLITVSYNKAGQLSGANKEIKVYKKSKSSTNLKLDYTFTEYDYKIEYGEKVTTYARDLFSDSNGKVKKKRNIIFKFTNDNGVILTEKINTDYLNKGGEEVRNSTIKSEFNDESQLIKLSTDDKYRTVVKEFGYDADQNIIAETKTTTEKTNNTKAAVIVNNTFDSKGLLVEKKEIKKKEGKLFETLVTKYTYTADKHNNPISKCKNTQGLVRSVYKADGEIFSESTTNKIRIKENGVWGPWKFKTY